MEAMQLSINMDATGEHIHRLATGKGYTVKEIQEVVGLGSPQAIYKWYSGKSLPSTDSLLILSKVLETTINEILVTDEDLPFYVTTLRYHHSFIKSRTTSPASISPAAAGTKALLPGVWRRFVNISSGSSDASGWAASAPGKSPSTGSMAGSFE